MFMATSFLSRYIIGILMREGLLERTEFTSYMTIIHLTTASPLYLFSMIYITLDKLLEVTLNITYPVHCTFTRAKYLVVFTWLAAFVTAAAVTIAHTFTEAEFKKHLKHLKLALCFLFLTIVVTTYTIIFYKYKRSQTHPSRRNVASASRHGWFTTFRNSRFYIQTLLILTFLCFTVCPMLIKRFMEIFSKAKHPLQAVLPVLFACLFISDACIYIFLYGPVKRLLWRKLRNMRCLRNIVPGNVHKDINLRRQATLQSGIVDSPYSVTTHF